MAHKSDITVVNSVFTRNFGPAGGGAVYNDNGTLNIINCTFAGNEGLTGAGGVENGPDAFTGIVNTILWNTGDELKGDSFSVSYSCVEEGYPGEGNVSENPQFVNLINPKGTDGYYGTQDDGLMLTRSSPCIDNGNNSAAPITDIQYNARPFRESVDIGAYEFKDYSQGCVAYGRLVYGEFNPISELPIIEKIYHWKFLKIYGYSKLGRVMRVAVDKNKYTSDDLDMYLYIRPADSLGNPIPEFEEVKITLKRVGEYGNKYYYQSCADDWGKNILFTSERIYHNYDNPWVYVIYMSEFTNLRYKVPKKQFVK